MNPKPILWLLTAILLALPLYADAQQPKKIPRIGYVSVSGNANRPGRYVEAFRQGLRDLGYEEGKNIVVEYRYSSAARDRVSDLVAELIQLNVDALVSSSAAAIQIAKQTTKTIPIVMVAPVDPIETGWIETLARPGGNITGVSRLGRELSGKRLEVFTELVPGLARVGILAATGQTIAKDYEPAARSLKLTLASIELSAPNPDFKAASQNISTSRLNGLITHGSSAINRYQKEIVELATNARLPSMFEVSGWVEGGGFASYSADDVATFKRAALYIDKILKGAKPADLPVEQPTKFELVINLNTANQIGVKIPPNLLARADRVIK